MKRSALSVSGLFLLSSLVACGGKSNPKKSEKQTGEVGGTNFIVVKNEGLKLEKGSASGSGQMIAVDPLKGLDSKTNFSLKFSLENNGHLALLSNSKGNLNGAIEIVFARKADALNFVMSSGNKDSKLVPLSGFDVSETISMSIDVHNDESPAHIIVWREGAEQPVYNSEVDGDAPGKGIDKFWGINLSKATLVSSKASGARFAHDDE